MKSVAADNETVVSPSYIPLPWEVFAGFCRMVWVGGVVTFGPTRQTRVSAAHQPAESVCRATLLLE